MSPTILHINKVNVSYSKKVNIFKNVSLQMQSNEIIALIGENGAGKSTLLKGICGLLDVTSGEIELFGKKLKNWNRANLAQKMAYVSSGENVRSLISVERFIGFGRYPYSGWINKATNEDSKFIENALDVCKIQYLRNKTMAQLSDGERQKVYLARAVAQNAELIILDEPTTHLDIKSSNSMFQLIKSQKESGRSVLFSSHQIDKALSIADKVWVVDCGSVIETTPEDFYKNERLKLLIFGE